MQETEIHDGVELKLGFHVCCDSSGTPVMHMHFMGISLDSFVTPFLSAWLVAG